jgi:hypothetical protein
MLGLILFIILAVLIVLVWAKVIVNQYYINLVYGIAIILIAAFAFGLLSGGSIRLGR